MGLVERFWAGRMRRREEELCFRATNRVVRPFEWGVEWSRRWPLRGDAADDGHDPAALLAGLNRRAIANSPEFFAYRTPGDYHLHGNLLRFSSPAVTPYPENNTVHGQWFPAASTRRSVIVLPHWNAPADAHNSLAIWLRKFGVSALRLSLPYHDYRMPAELNRADYAVSSNIGRTLDASRQAVVDIRAAADWLERQGAERIGIVGTSLGSCYAFLAAAHDPRFKACFFNHCSTHFADVVWTGLSTAHIRQSLEGNIGLDRLREMWLAISPVVYFDKFAETPKKCAFLYALYDTTFIPELSAQVIAMAARHKLDFKSIVLQCGHYTLGETPFKYIDGYQIISFLLKNL